MKKIKYVSPVDRQKKYTLTLSDAQFKRLQELRKNRTDSKTPSPQEFKYLDMFVAKQYTEPSVLERMGRGLGDIGRSVQRKFAEIDLPPLDTLTRAAISGSPAGMISSIATPPASVPENQRLSGPELIQRQNEIEKQYRERRGPDPGIDFARGLGQFLGTVGTGPQSLLGQSTVAGVTAASLPDYKGDKTLLQRSVEGGIAGVSSLGGGKLLNEAGKLIAPKISDAGRKVIEQGIYPRLARIKRPVYKAVDALTSFGPIERMGQKLDINSIKKYNFAVYETILNNIKKTLPKQIDGEDIGTARIDDVGKYVKQQISDTYEQLKGINEIKFGASKTNKTQRDSFNQDVNNYNEKVKLWYDTNPTKTEVFKQFAPFINRLEKRFNEKVGGNIKDSVISGKEFVEFDKYLGKQADNFINKDRDVFEIIKSMQTILRTGVDADQKASTLLSNASSSFKAMSRVDATFPANVSRQGIFEPDEILQQDLIQNSPSIISPISRDVSKINIKTDKTPPDDLSPVSPIQIYAGGRLAKFAAGNPVGAGLVGTGGAGGAVAKTKPDSLLYQYLTSEPGPERKILRGALKYSGRYGGPLSALSTEQGLLSPFVGVRSRDMGLDPGVDYGKPYYTIDKSK